MPVNERSLANLKLPKTKREDYGYQYALPQNKIDELFAYLAEGKSLKKAAAATKICFETAKKYYEQGDPKRGIKPLRYRITIFQEKISEKFNVLVEERRMKRLETITRAIDNFDKKIQKGSLLTKPNFNQLDKLIRLEVFLLGGVTSKEKETKMLSAEEISGGDNK